MATAVEVEQLAEAGARLAASAGAGPGAPPRGPPGALQRLLHEGIGEWDTVLGARLAEKVADVEALVVGPIKVQPSLHLGDGRPFRRRHLPPPIQQPVIPVTLVPEPQAPDAAGAP